MLSDFLHAVWGDNDFLGEIRSIGPTGIKQAYVPTSDTDHAAELALQQDRNLDCDVYYGVLPRVTRGGTAKDCVSWSNVLWADVDAKNTGGKHAALAGIRMARITPSIIVDSGHGWHCYWLLRQPAPWLDAHEAMRALAREVRGDAVYDAPRILRVPGTRNHKDPDPLPVRIVYWDIERRHRITDFPVVDEQPVYPTTAAGVERTLDLSPWLAELIANGAPKGQRSEAVFRVVLWMLRYGRTEDEIREVMRVSAIGEKYRDKGKDGDRWLKRTIEAALHSNQ